MRNITTYDVTAYVDRAAESAYPDWLCEARFRDEPSARRFAVFCLLCIRPPGSPRPDHPGRYSCELTRNALINTEPGRPAPDSGWESGAGIPELVDTGILDEDSGEVIWQSSAPCPPMPAPARLRLVKPPADHNSDKR